MSSRIRFLAIRPGVHVLEKLKVIGIGEELDHTISPVLSVVIGSGIDLAR